MDELRPSQVTQLLEAMRNGDAAAGDRLLPLVYDNLRGLARAVSASSRNNHTLQPTALVHEAWMKIADGVDKLNDRQHFFAVAARAMRQVLADYARAQQREKRGGRFQHVTLDESISPAVEADCDLVALHEALEQLTELNQRHARVVEMRILGGLTIDETANALNVGPTTVKADWSLARAWLVTALAAK